MAYTAKVTGMDFIDNEMIQEAALGFYNRLRCGFKPIKISYVGASFTHKNFINAAVNMSPKLGRSTKNLQARV